MTRRTASITVIVVLAACSSVKHPLDDSETRPADLDAAVGQSEVVLGELDAEVLTGIAHAVAVWDAPQGCAVNQDAPEQGEVARIVYRSYPDLPSDTTPDDLLAAAREHWESQGHTVGEGAANMAPQVIARIDGVSYSLVDNDEGVEARAFLPCPSS